MILWLLCVFFKDYVEALFGSGLLVVGVALLITACFIGLCLLRSSPFKDGYIFRDAFIIGVAQACAVRLETLALVRSSSIATGILLRNKQ